MRKRTTFFVILLCLLSLQQAEAKKTDNKPHVTISMPPLCDLPAPASISWSFPTSTTLLVTWTPVPGAWGYYASLTSNAGTQGGSTQGTSMLYNVTPNTSYSFRVYSKCDSLSTSSRYTGGEIPTYLVITDILIDRADACSSLTNIPDLDKNTTPIDFISTQGVDYYLRFMKNNVPYDLYFKRSALQFPPAPPLPDYKFIMQPVVNQASILICDGTAGGNAPNCPKARFTGGGAQAYIEMYKLVQSSASDQILVTNTVSNPFDSYELYACTKKQFNGGNGNRDAFDSNPHSYVVSPFHDYLQIGLDASKRLKSIRMMDISGRLTYEQIMPDNLEFSDQLILPTEQLARGLYILQLQSNDGKVEVFKVVKE